MQFKGYSGKVEEPLWGLAFLTFAVWGGFRELFS